MLKIVTKKLNLRNAGSIDMTCTLEQLKAAGIAIPNNGLDISIELANKWLYERLEVRYVAKDTFFEADATFTKEDCDTHFILCTKPQPIPETKKIEIDEKTKAIIELLKDPVIKEHMKLFVELLK